MTHGQEIAGQRVVVVDGLSETAQVLRAVFEPQGHSVERVRGYEAAKVIASAGRSVLVIHDDGRPESARRFKHGTVPRVVIGALSPDPVSEEGLDPSSGPRERRLSQPFQYPELIRAIESLIADEEPRAAA